MNIGLDVDGVMTDLLEYIIEEGTKYLYEKGIEINDLDVNHYNTKDIFNISKELDKEIWEHMIYDYSTKERPRMHVSEITKKLKEKGHTIYIITARNSMTKDQMEENIIEKALEEWLKKYEIVHDELIFETDKRKAIVDKDIDIMVDDSPYVIRDIEKLTNVVVFNAPYNRGSEFDHLKRVYSWHHILEFIESVEENA